VLSDQLRVSLARLANVLRPEADRLEARFLARLEKLDFDVRQRRALSSLTIGSMARFLSRGCPPSDFFEEVEYSGRRLAKLNLPPSAISSALAEYDKMLTPVLQKLMPNEFQNFHWVREQLQFCVMLTLNNAYYQVRETETQAFYEMFWAELEARTLEDLMQRLLAILARFCKADQAHLFLVNSSENGFDCRASYGTSAVSHRRSNSFARLKKTLSTPRCVSGGRAGKGILLDPAWVEFSSSWSIPMMERGKLAGVFQFGFLRHYEWLPRELQLLNAAAERSVMAAEKAKLVEDLGARQAQVRRLAESMMQVEEAERRRISRELHDQTGQDLLWIRLQMEMIEKELPESEHGWKPRIAEVRDMTERTIVEVRRLIAALSPAVLEQLGLAPAMRQLVNRFRSNHSSRVRLQVGRLGPMPKQLEVIAYRLVQECLNNIAKHSYCSNVNISINTADGILRLFVEDDGVGFRVEEALRKPGSFGLAGIRERVALLGGRCVITSRPSMSKAADRSNREQDSPGGETVTQKRKRAASGTRICVELPMPEGGSKKEAVSSPVLSSRIA